MNKKPGILILCLLFIFSNAFCLTYHQSAETLNKIMEIIINKEKGVYLRFGDGDLILAYGKSDDSFQKRNTALQQEMREAFALNGKNILKCLPLGCKELGGLEEGMFDGNHQQSYKGCMNMLKLAAPLWNDQIDNIYSPTALAYCSTHQIETCLKFLKFLKESNCCLFVGNCKIPPHIRKLLFGSQCHFVATPERDAYAEIDRIEKECLRKIRNVKSYKIIITSMGCSGRILQKRLWYKVDDLFLFDFGSLMDALCGWKTRDWMILTHFDQHKFLELLIREFVYKPIKH